MIKPRARAAPMLCVLRNIMWMLGGQVSIGHRDEVVKGHEAIWHCRSYMAWFHLGVAGEPC